MHLKKKYFNKYATVEEAKQHVPPNLSQENWNKLCDCWGEEKTKEKAAKYAVNRGKNKMLHNQGSKAFVVSAEEMKQKNQLSDGEFYRKDFFKYTWFKEGKGWITTEAEATYASL